MKEKSLRVIAKELGVSNSYLSQVINGKCPASKNIVYGLTREGLLSINGKQVVSKFLWKKRLKYPIMNLNAGVTQR
jgi:transcriptional regulator with XRE-family HTH domain